MAEINHPAGAVRGVDGDESGRLEASSPPDLDHLLGGGRGGGGGVRVGADGRSRVGGGGGGGRENGGERNYTDRGGEDQQIRQKVTAEVSAQHGESPWAVPELQ